MRYPTILLALLCVACGSYSNNVPTIKPYKMDIQQGNVVTSKMMLQLRPGMSKSQVRFIMGTPLLQDSFHGDRWDYFYQMRKEGKIIEQRRIILEFEGDTLAHVRGDVIPAGTDAAGQPTAAVQPKPAKAAPKEKGLLDKLKFWGDDEAEANKAQPAPEPSKPAQPATVEAAPATASPQAAEPAAEPERAEAPLPPLMDPSMQPKPETVQAAPQPAAKAAKIAPVEAKPAATQPAAEAQPQEQKRGLLDKLKFWGDDDKPKAEPPSKPVEAPKKLEAAKAAVPQKPAMKPQAETRAMTAPQPPADLPPEDSPDFFEKMLEKIGF